MAIVEVNAGGYVTKVEVDTVDVWLADCIKTRMKVATFPKTVAGGRFRWPFTFAK